MRLSYAFIAFFFFMTGLLIFLLSPLLSLALMFLGVLSLVPALWDREEVRATFLCAWGDDEACERLRKIVEEACRKAGRCPSS
ncbi:hypothetical protein [Thermoproteus tenax]|uniref:Uncharacterized protein n=1 Tax=Thermoproteus tenax (strain ATCC 35583 / DSM 2078 / JCM 9277 / NBRC 100435 / Kra 1) TaxID=768679 RepID=G4RJQ8_THETK|nr:hypothetical protein [Thermoproteus tenax]CCC81803.1 hypothetical protein predicted by Glimmer/Critica [Thermoproteus tenax Kra 1]